MATFNMANMGTTTSSITFRAYYGGSSSDRNAIQVQFYKDGVSMSKSQTYPSPGSKNWTTNNVTATGLSADTWYDFSCEFYDSGYNLIGGTSIRIWTDAVSVPDLDVPTGLSVSSVTTTTASVSWEYTDYGTGYEYELYSGSSRVQSGSRSRNYVDLTDLSPSTTYSFRVRNTEGYNTSDWSYFATITTLSEGPPTPYIEIDNITSSSARISVYYAGSVDSYLVAAMKPGGSWQDYGTFYSPTINITGLQPSTAYIFRIRTIKNYIYSNFSNQVSVITLEAAPPPTPTIYKGTQTTSSATISVTGHGDATSFNIQGRRDDTSVWSNYGSSTSTSILISSLLSGRTYDFRIQGVRASVVSGWSNIITFNIGTTRPSNWDWEYTILPDYNFWNQVGSNVFLMRASHWNTFTNTINLFRVYKLGNGYDYPFTQATTSTTEVGIRTCVNQAIDKVNDMVTSKIPNVVSGETVKASTFTLLRDRLNSL